METVGRGSAVTWSGGTAHGTHRAVERQSGLRLYTREREGRKGEKGREKSACGRARYERSVSAEVHNVEFEFACLSG